MKKCASILFGFLIVPFLGAWAPVFSQDEVLVVIANSSVPVDQISMTELNDYYLKKKRFWPNGEPVRPITWIEGRPERRIFVSRVLEKTENDLSQYWMSQKLYTGDQPPMSLDSSKSICNIVASVKGSLGYLPASSDVLKTCTGVKIIGKVE